MRYRDIGYRDKGYRDIGYRDVKIIKAIGKTLVLHDSFKVY